MEDFADIQMFEDLDIDESDLFGTNIGHDFTDNVPHVFRAVATSMTAELAQRTTASWYRQFIRGRSKNWEPPEAEMPSPPSGLEGVLLSVWKRNAEVAARKAARMKPDALWLCCMADLAGEGVSAANLVDWTLDVFTEIDNPNVSALALRRAVADELRLESESAGSWETWLCHLAWIAVRRDQLAADEAITSWHDFRKNEKVMEARAVGIRVFMAWLNSLPEEDIPLLTEAVENDSPLDEDSPSSEVAVIGV